MRFWLALIFLISVSFFANAYGVAEASVVNLLPAVYSLNFSPDDEPSTPGLQLHGDYGNASFLFVSFNANDSNGHPDMNRSAGNCSIFYGPVLLASGALNFSNSSCSGISCVDIFCMASYSFAFSGTYSFKVAVKDLFGSNSSSLSFDVLVSNIPVPNVTVSTGGGSSVSTPLMCVRDGICNSLCPFDADCPVVPASLAGTTPVAQLLPANLSAGRIFISEFIPFNLQTANAVYANRSAVILGDKIAISFDNGTGKSILTAPFVLPFGQRLHFFDDPHFGVSIDSKGTLDYLVFDSNLSAVGILTAKTDGFIGTGRAASAVVEDVLLSSFYLEAPVENASMQPKAVNYVPGSVASVKLDLNLNRFPVNAVLDIKLNEPLADSTETAIGALADKNNFILVGRALVVEFKRANLPENMIDSASLTFEVSREFVEKNGGISSLRLFGINGNDVEILDAKFAGRKEDKLVFTVKSGGFYAKYALYQVGAFVPVSRILEQQQREKVISPGLTLSLLNGNKYSIGESIPLNLKLDGIEGGSQFNITWVAFDSFGKKAFEYSRFVEFGKFNSYSFDLNELKIPLNLQSGAYFVSAKLVYEKKAVFSNDVTLAVVGNPLDWAAVAMVALGALGVLGAVLSVLLKKRKKVHNSPKL